MGSSPEYIEAHREEIREYNLAWHAAHPEYSKAQANAWRKAHPEQKRATNAKWAMANPEKVKASMKKWRDANKNKKRQECADRRHKKGLVFVESVDPQVVYERDHGVCQLCFLPIGLAKWHVDHSKPISKGGTHEYANVQLSHAACNLSKGAKWEANHGVG